jgi:hypothetical protein
MSIQLQGVINGKHIELETEPELPPGSVVIVDIQPKPLTLEEQRHMIDALCGAWKNDNTIVPIFAEIERERAESMPREVNLDETA